MWSSSDPVCEGFPLASYCLLTDGDAFVLGLMDLSGLLHNTGIGLKKELQDFFFFKYPVNIFH